MKKVCTCLAGDRTSAAPGSSVEPINPRARGNAPLAHVIWLASTVPLVACVNRSVTWNRLDAQGIDQEVNTTLKKWEYASVPLISHALQEILNQWGEEGWELVQVQESQTTGTVAFMKRPKEEGSGA